MQGRDFAEVEKLIYAEIERIKNEPVEDWELEKVFASIRRSRTQALQSSLTRAILLGQFAVYYNDPGLLNSYEAKLRSVSKADLQRVARAYFPETNRSVITTTPKAGAPARPPAGQP
jgi:predicted Zn-dependent peptidase